MKAVGFVGGAAVALVAMFMLPPELAWKFVLGLIAAAAIALILVAPRISVAAALAAVAVLVATGVLATSQVPGLSQAAHGKAALERWRNEQTSSGSTCFYGPLSSNEVQSFKQLGVADPDCASGAR